jgi:hypothetical protein
MVMEYRAFIKRETSGVGPEGRAGMSLLEMGCPEDIASGKRFEQLAAEKRVGNGTVVVPAAAALDADNRARAAAIGAQIDAENKAKAAEFARLIAADKV